MGIELTKAETRWVAETGIAPEKVERREGVAVVWRACGRCGGTGYVWATHVDGGKCFACYTAKGKWVTLKGIAAAVRARKRRNEKRVAEAYVARREAAVAARKFLAETPGLAVALRHGENTLIRKFARHLATRGGMTEKMVACAFRMVEEAANKPTEIEPPTGRVEIEGTVLKVTEVEGYLGRGFVEKMLVGVETREGAYRVWGTVPGAIEGIERGTKVAFTATVEPKEAGFGFFKRPAKAEVIAAIGG